MFALICTVFALPDLDHKSPDLGDQKNVRVLQQPVNVNFGATPGALAALIAFHQAHGTLAPLFASGVVGQHLQQTLPNLTLTFNPNPTLPGGFNAFKDAGGGQSPPTGSGGTGLPPGVFPQNACSVAYTDDNGQVYSGT